MLSYFLPDYTKDALLILVLNTGTGCKSWGKLTSMDEIPKYMGFYTQSATENPSSSTPGVCTDGILRLKVQSLQSNLNSRFAQ